MNNLTIVRALHVISIVFWIGGVGFVTAVILPSIKRNFKPQEQLKIFEIFESSFSFIVKFFVIITGITGFYMTSLFHAWDRFTQPQFFWMHAMVFIWAIFMLALFVVEPLIQRRINLQQNHAHINENFKRIQLIHWILLFVSLATIFVSVLGSHGFFY